jgi:hypothetical protein
MERYRRVCKATKLDFFAQEIQWFVIQTSQPRKCNHDDAGSKAHWQELSTNRYFLCETAQ